MTFRNKYLFIIFSVLCLAGLIHQLIRYYNKQDIYESPKELSGKKEVILVKHISRPCNCPTWTETKRADTNKKTIVDFFYLEPATLDLLMPEALAGRLDSSLVLKLEGKFYHGKAVPGYYKSYDPEPEKANIFHYTAFEIIKPEATR